MSGDALAECSVIRGQGRAAAVGAALLWVSISGCAAMRDIASEMMGVSAPRVGLVGTRSADALSEEEIERRLAFVCERLDAGRRHAAYWQYGWLVVNGGGAIASSVQASFSEDTDQVFDIIEAVKGGIGVIYLVAAPMPGRHGADPIRAMPDETRADKLAQLDQAEGILYKTAARSRLRYSWLFHIGNLVFNLIGGAILLALDDPGNAALSAGLDSAVGEIQIWTQPWNPPDDWKDYERFVAGEQAVVPTPSSSSWRIRSNGRGLAFAIEF